MDPIHALHNGARHHVLARHARWDDEARRLARDGRTYVQRGAGQGTLTATAEARSLQARFAALNAIRDDVESTAPEDFSTLEALRSTLVEIGHTAPVWRASDERTEPFEAVDERARFVAFVQTAEPAALHALRELPYRRRLTWEEWRARRDAFAVRWGEWYGGVVTPAHHERGTLTLHAAVLDEPGVRTALQEVLRRLGVTRVLQVYEFNSAYALALEGVELNCGAEDFWTDDTMDWMIHASHESTMTFGGEALVEVMRRYETRFLPRHFRESSDAW